MRTLLVVLCLVVAPVQGYAGRGPVQHDGRPMFHSHENMHKPRMHQTPRANTHGAPAKNLGGVLINACTSIPDSAKSEVCLNLLIRLFTAEVDGDTATMQKILDELSEFAKKLRPPI